MRTPDTAFTLRSLFTLVLLAAATLPCSGFAQGTDASGLVEAQRQYLGLIDSIEEDKGVNAVELIEPLAALSKLYLEQGRYEEAASGFERTRGVIRMNHGFSTLQELELLWQQAKAEEAAGDFAAAWALDEAVIRLAGEHAANLATYSIYNEFADKRLALLEQYRSGHFPPQIELGCYYGLTDDVPASTSADTNRHCKNSGNRNTVLLTLLGEARNFQLAAIATLLANDRYAGAELQRLVTSLLRASEQLHRLNRGHSDPYLAHLMQRVLAYETKDSAAQQQQASFLVQLADMNVYHANPGTRPTRYDFVLDQYLKAHAQLTAAGLAQDALDAIFAPQIPVLLPSYANNPLVPLAGTNSAAYIDVEFDINQYGRSEHVTIVAATDGVKRADRRALARLIAENRFRPYLRNGEFAESTHVAVRYYLPAAAAATD